MFVNISERELRKIFIDPYLIEEKLYHGYYELCKNITAEIELDKGSIFLEGVQKALLNLPKEEQEVIKLRYGLLDGVSHNLYETAQELKITVYSAKTSEAKALRILRRPENYRQITSYGKISLLEEQIEKLNNILNQKNKMLKRFTEHIWLHRLGLSTRAYNCLINAGYERVDQITHFTSIEELMTIKNMGITSATEIWNKLYENDDDITSDMSLRDTKLSTRAFNCLTKEGFNTVSEVRSLSDTELMKISGVGEGVLQEIKEKL